MVNLWSRRAHYEEVSVLLKGHCSQTWLICGHRIILNWNCGCCCCCCCRIFNDVVFAERHVTLLPSHVAGGRVMFIMFIMFIFHPMHGTQITWWSCSTTPPPPGCPSGSWTKLHVKKTFLTNCFTWNAPAVVVLPHHRVRVHLRGSLVPVLASSTRLRLAHSPHVCDSRTLACRWFSSTTGAKEQGWKYQWHSKIILVLG